MKQINHSDYSACRPQLLDIEGFEHLVELALDLRCTWNHAADPIWYQLDADLWELTHNPWTILQTTSREKVESVLTSTGVQKKIADLVRRKRKLEEKPGWFQQLHDQSNLNCVAYFSMEFMLSEALPIYSGGLGNVAGDQLKAASDLGVPVVGVGLLYQQGYFRQLIDQEGHQQAFYPYNDPGQLPISPVRHKNGEWLRLRVKLPGFSIWLRAWQVQVGRVRLYLLDSNDCANFPAYQGITSELYGGGQELRLQQEMILGIAGWRLLKELGIKPDVCHLNEGHAAFAVLERSRDFMESSGLDFKTALTTTRIGNLFTTHTAVPAGFDLFPTMLIEKHLSRYVRSLGISMDELLALGRADQDNSNEPFNMAYLAVRGSGFVNGVSCLHGEVSRNIFGKLFPRWPKDEVPIEYITNGIHVPSWDSQMADTIWTQSCGKERWHGTADSLEQDIHCVSDHDLWQFRTAARSSLIEYARQRLTRHLAAGGASNKEIIEAKTLLDPNFLTLGFARRFATYKRPDLLLHDPERLQRILTNINRPVQLILAGKAHPADQAGQAIIKRWVEFIRQTDARQHVMFLSDYDMLLTERLVQGVDVWINTPRRPWEACGTSGMKVLVNGGLNVSELDGWWVEAYSPEVGWALGDGKEHDGDPSWDATEADELYRLLEEEIIPEFYSRDVQGIPVRWVARVRESMSQLTPVYSAERAVREYTEQYYLPAANAYKKRVANNCQLGIQLADWQQNLRQQWQHLRFGDRQNTTLEDTHRVEIQVYIDDIEQNSIAVELFADRTNGNEPERIQMQQGDELVGAINGYIYFVQFPNTRPINDYTPRIVAKHDSAHIPLEANQIIWQQ